MGFRSRDYEATTSVLRTSEKKTPELEAGIDNANDVGRTSQIMREKDAKGVSG
jgi:hypothetical protein